MEREYIDVESKEVEYYVLDAEAYYKQFSLLDFASRYIKDIKQVSDHLYEFSFYECMYKRFVIATIDEKNHRSYYNKDKLNLFDILSLAGDFEPFADEVEKFYGVKRLDYAVECYMKDGTKFEREPKGIWKSV